MHNLGGNYNGSDNQRTNLNRQLRQPVYAILAAALVMLLCVFLPDGTATGERRDWIDADPDSIIEESLGLTAQDLAQVSTVEYTRLYVTVADEWGFTTAYLGFYVALLGLLLLFPLLTALCALLRKPIGAMLFTALTFGVSCIQNADYTMRGILSKRQLQLGHRPHPLAHCSRRSLRRFCLAAGRKKSAANGPSRSLPPCRNHSSRTKRKPNNISTP